MKLGTRLMPSPACVAARLAVRKAQASRYRDGDRLAGVRGPEMPIEGVAEIGVDYAVMTDQTFGTSRLAALFEIGRRAHYDDPHIAKFARDQGAVRRVADSDGDVEAFIDKVHNAVREAHVELDIGKGAREVQKCGGEPDRAERYRQCQPHPSRGSAGGAADGGVQDIEFLQQRLHPLVVGLADLSRRQRPCSPFEKLDAEVGLQLRDQFGRLLTPSRSAALAKLPASSTATNMRSQSRRST
jgi:hypothetical protein